MTECPIIWLSELQTETVLSTIELKIIALGNSCRELFPITDVVKLLGEVVHLPIGSTIINVSIHKDNAGALLLVETLPPDFKTVRKN